MATTELPTKPGDFEDQESAAYKELVGEYLDAATVAANMPPDRDTIWRVVDWLLSESDQLPADLIVQFDALLSTYKTKIKIMAYSVMRERVERIVESAQAERDLLEELLDSAPYMANGDKVKLLTTLSESIVSGLQQLDQLAGVTDNPEDVINEIRGKLKAGTAFDDFPPERREKIRRVVEMFINRTNVTEEITVKETTE